MKKEIKVMDEWKVNDAAQTLKKAGEIFNDEDLLAAAEAKLKEEKKGIKSVADLKKAYDKYCCEDMEESEEEESEEDGSEESEPMPTKPGMKAPPSDKASEVDQLPPDSMFTDYKQAKKDNESKLEKIKRKAKELED